jgi:ion channel-forming bestrophin family protein
VAPPAGQAGAEPVAPPGDEGGTEVVIGEKLPWGTILRLHAPWLALMALVTGGAWAASEFLGVKLHFTPTPFQIAGVALAIFLGFRNNSAYDRWWEGRKLWGGIVNQSRALGRQVMTLPHATGLEAPELEALRREVLYRHMAWLHALKQQLRGDNPLAELAPFLSAEELEALGRQKNVAAWLLHRNGQALAEAARRSWLSDIRLEMFDRTLTELISLQGGCERIKSTPIPTAYRVFTRLFTRVYIVALPLGLMQAVEFAPLLVLLGLGLAFLVLETVGRLLEDPFTTGPNALALGAICRTIEINLRQQLEETELPAPATPQVVRGVQVLL